MSFRKKQGCNLNMQKKILAVTGIRSDYDLMTSLFHRLEADPSVDLRLLVGGAHLSKSYGFTLQQIRQDGFSILQAIESLLDSDSVSGRLKSASIFLQGAVDVVAAWAPDIIIYAGDREEVLIGALLGAHLEIPTIHFYGGDHTSTGHVDNPVRHATSKLSTFHAVTLEEHRQRLIMMGEPEFRIRVIGNMALDNLLSVKAYSPTELEREIGLPQDFSPYALVLFHPDPLERDEAHCIVESIIQVLKQKGIRACIGYPNTDPANFGIIKVIEKYRSDKDFFVYRNLGRREFISVYRGASFIIGNSSSGILEAASIPIPAVNVGMRQRGRACGRNVVFCDATPDSIEHAVAQVQSIEFLKEVKTMTNPYGTGGSSQKAHALIMGLELTEMRLKSEDPLNITGEIR
jgi:UDP-hydrolysing UDP-N-acetyl-D-glucosamine 2-epimerase